MSGFFKRRVKQTGKNVSNAMELGIFVSVLQMIRDIFVNVFMPWKAGEPGQAETFEEAIARLGLKEGDLEERKAMFFWQTLFFLAFGLVILAYGVALAFERSLNGMVYAFVVAVLCWAYAFRNHFWLFQLKQRKLGCTFKEWLDSSLKG